MCNKTINEEMIKAVIGMLLEEGLINTSVLNKKVNVKTDDKQKEDKKVTDTSDIVAKFDSRAGIYVKNIEDFTNSFRKLNVSLTICKQVELFLSLGIETCLYFNGDVLSVAPLIEVKMKGVQCFNTRGTPVMSKIEGFLDKNIFNSKSKLDDKDKLFISMVRQGIKPSILNKTSDKDLYFFFPEISPVAITPVSKLLKKMGYGATGERNVVVKYLCSRFEVYNNKAYEQYALKELADKYLK